MIIIIIKLKGIFGKSRSMVKVKIQKLKLTLLSKSKSTYQVKKLIFDTKA